VLGVSPLAYAGSITFLNSLRGIDSEATGLFAHNAYDCLNIIALAAQAAGSDRPADIAAQIPAVTSTGTRCNSFPECITSLTAGRNINYDGPGGNLSIDASGEMVSAVFERFTFDENGRDVATGQIRVGDG
jgi:branched-chain amino acid transport system substrate-binding protein